MAMDYAETTAAGNPVTVKRMRRLPGRRHRGVHPEMGECSAGTFFACHSCVTSQVDKSRRKAKEIGVLETRSLSSCSL